MVWNDFIGDSTRELLARMVAYLPTALAATLALVVGVVLARLARRLLVREQSRCRLEALYSTAGVTGFLKKLRPDQDPCLLVGNLFFLIAFCAVAVVVLEILGLKVASTLSGQLLRYLPNLAVAFAVVVAGSYFSRKVRSFLERRLQAGQGRFLPRSAIAVVQGMIIFATMSMALYQLGIARGLVASIFVSLIGGASLAVFLSFGLASAEVGKALLAGGVWLKAASEQKPSDLTPKQYELFVFLRSFAARNNRPPLIREMQEALGNKSTKSVAYKLEQLQRKGYIRREKGKHRGIVILK
ncbi:MAG: hypothetical protein JSW03_11015 [Candidatus Eiseniibacteriota bacterium]|nr:MAG: hypothetical protein JSW03_11015 [Candidatus Eisenbacteria bacterium]